MSAGSPATRREAYAGQGLASRLRGHRHALADARRRLRAEPLAAAATLATLALALLLPLLLGSLLANLRQQLGTVEDARGISVFLDPTLDATAAQALAREWQAKPGIAAVQARSPQQGWAELGQLSGLAGAIELLEDHPLPWVLVVQPAAGTDGERLAGELAAAPAVAGVQYDHRWRQQLDAWLDLSATALLLFGLLLALGAALVVGNTVRLDLAGRRDEIALKLQLGAEDADILRPLLYVGALHGLSAALLAWLGALLAIRVLAAPLAALAGPGGEQLLTGPGVVGLLLVLAAGGSLGWLGARLAASHHLRTSRRSEP